MALTYHYITLTGAGSKSGADWANAFDLAAFYTDFASVVAGSIYFFEGDSTYTLTANISTATDGTDADPIAIIGVANGTTNEGNSITYSDFAQDTDRPFFDGGASYSILFDDRAILRNIRAESEVADVIKMDSQGYCMNCKSENTYNANAPRTAFRAGGQGTKFIDCEAISENIGFAMVQNCQVLFCYIHDSASWANTAAVESDDHTLIFGCIFDSFRRGVQGSGSRGVHIIHCVFYNVGDLPCITDEGSLTGGWTALNNIFSGCESAIEWITPVNNDLLQSHNHMYDNTADWTNVPAVGDPEDLFADYFVGTGNPNFINAGSMDFTLLMNSPALDTGRALNLGVG